MQIWNKAFTDHVSKKIKEKVVANFKAEPMTIWVSYFPSS